MSAVRNECMALGDNPGEHGEEKGKNLDVITWNLIKTQANSKRKMRELPGMLPLDIVLSGGYH